MIQGRLVQQAVGNSPWFPVDCDSLAFWVALCLSFDSPSNLTAAVQHTYSNISQRESHQVAWSQTGTTVTVTDNGVPSPPTSIQNIYTGHGLITGDSVIISASSFPSPESTYTAAGLPAGVDQNGRSPITVTSKTQYTYVTQLNQNALGVAQAVNIRVLTNAFLTGKTARADGNYNSPVRAVRLAVTAGTTGAAILEILQGRGVGGGS